MNTKLPHTIIGNIPIIDLRDPVVQELLDLDHATSAGHKDIFVIVYRTTASSCIPSFVIASRAFFSADEAYARREESMPNHGLIFEGILPITVRQAKQKDCIVDKIPSSRLVTPDAQV